MAIATSYDTTNPNGFNTLHEQPTFRKPDESIHDACETHIYPPSNRLPWRSFTVTEQWEAIDRHEGFGLTPEKVIEFCCQHWPTGDFVGSVIIWEGPTAIISITNDAGTPIVAWVEGPKAGTRGPYQGPRYNEAGELIAPQPDAEPAEEEAHVITIAAPTAEASADDDDEAEDDDDDDEIDDETAAENLEYHKGRRVHPANETLRQVRRPERVEPFPALCRSVLSVVNPVGLLNNCEVEVVVIGDGGKLPPAAAFPELHRAGWYSIGINGLDIFVRVLD